MDYRVQRENHAVEVEGEDDLGGRDLGERRGDDPTIWFPVGRTAWGDAHVGLSRTATMAVRQNAMAMGCISGTRRTSTAAVLMAKIDKKRTKDTR